MHKHPSEALLPRQGQLNFNARTSVMPSVRPHRLRKIGIGDAISVAEIAEANAHQIESTSKVLRARIDEGMRQRKSLS